MEHYGLVPELLWDGQADAARPGAAVIVQGERIQAVVSADRLEPDLPLVKLPGCTLLPGLLDAHVHFSTAMSAGFLAAGVTTVRDVGNDLEWILAQRSRHASDPMLGPTILCCGHLHDGAKPIWPRLGKANPDAAALRASIRHHVTRGVDQIKLYAGLDAAMLTAGVDEAHRQGKFVLAHLGRTSPEDACRAGLNEIEHLDRCEVAWRPATEAEDDALIDLMLEHKVVIDPTLVVWDRLGRILERSFYHDQRRRWVHPCHLGIWDRFRTRYKDPEGRLRYQAAIPHLKRFLRRAHGRGVVVALGTDSPFAHLIPGFSVHDELAMYVDAGITAADALRAATSVNAGVLGVASHVGRIAPGFVADLLAVRGNPLITIGDISNVAHVVHAGRAVDLDELSCRLTAMAAQQPDDAITRDLLDFVGAAAATPQGVQSV